MPINDDIRNFAEFEKKQGEDGRIIELHRQQNGKDEKWKQKKDFNVGF